MIRHALALVLVLPNASLATTTESLKPRLALVSPFASKDIEARNLQGAENEDFNPEPFYSPPNPNLYAAPPPPAPAPSYAPAKPTYLEAPPAPPPPASYSPPTSDYQTPSESPPSYSVPEAPNVPVYPLTPPPKPKAPQPSYGTPDLYGAPEETLPAQGDLYGAPEEKYPPLEDLYGAPEETYSPTEQSYVDCSDGSAGCEAGRPSYDPYQVASDLYTEETELAEKDLNIYQLVPLFLITTVAVILSTIVGSFFTG